MELPTLKSCYFPSAITVVQVQKVISTKTHNFDIRRNKSPNVFQNIVVFQLGTFRSSVMSQYPLD
jgi:hypothetical protein